MVRHAERISTATVVFVGIRRAGRGIDGGTAFFVRRRRRRRHGRGGIVERRRGESVRRAVGGMALGVVGGQGEVTAVVVVMLVMEVVVKMRGMEPGGVVFRIAAGHLAVRPTRMDASGPWRGSTERGRCDVFVVDGVKTSRQDSLSLSLSSRWRLSRASSLKRRSAEPPTCWGRATEPASTLQPEAERTTRREEAEWTGR
ncbi:hypothetical protein VTN02DRAFT_215 [Thermoascus thermophilus]